MNVLLAEACCDDLPELRQAFLRQSRVRLEAMDRAIQQLAGHATAPAPLGTLRDQFHCLAGSAGSYGFAAASRIARHAEEACEAVLAGESAPLGRSFWLGVVAELRDALAEGIAGTVCPIPLGAGRERLRGAGGDGKGPGGDSAAPLDRTAGREPRVLLADDDALVCRLLATRLRAEGWQVCHAADGEQAERLLDEESFDLILLDLHMPFRNGFELLQAVAQGRSSAKVVVLSALDREEAILRAFALGAEDFIGKPFSPEVVAARLRRLLARRAG